MALHPFLARLLRKAGAVEDAAPTPEAWSSILRVVDKAFRDADSDRYTLERSIDISSAEMQGLYENVRRNAVSFRDLVEHLPDPTFVHHDGVYEVVYANSAMGELFGCDVLELIGRSTLELMHPDDHAMVMERRRLRREIGGGTSPLIVRVIRADGAVRTVRSTTVSVRYDTKPAQLVVVRDITDEIELAAAQRRLEEQLRQSQKMEAIGQLAGGVAHDFNNMLAAILANAELAQDDLHDPRAVVEALTEIEAAAHRAAALTKQLLAFSRKQKLQPKRLELGTVVTGLQAMLRRLVGEDIEMTSRHALDVGTIEADQGQLEQVIVNLVVNARDAMPKGGEIAIDTCARGNFAVLTVRDTGIGMTPDVQARMFDPFFTTKEVGRGTGLGLSTVFGIVQQSGGSIEVDSEVGRGTAIRILLPVVAGAATPLERSRNRTKDPTAHGTVLVVEDDDQVRSVVRRYLRSWGYEVLEARDGPSALALARAHSGTIDLLLTDVVMPAMDGQTLARHVLERRPTTRVLYMSGYTEHPAIAGAFEADFVHKPFTGAQLAEAIKRVFAPAAVLRSVR